MGYFSENQIELQDKYSDQSYHGFEEQLRWRYEDLKDRYRELLDVDAPVCGDDYFTTDDYRYAPIQCFKTIRDVWRAMEIAKEDLEEKCDIIVREDAAYLFCEEKIAPYLADNFTQARHTTLRCAVIDQLPEGELFKTQRVSVQLSSERLDALIAHVHKMSRSDAQALFPAGKIYVNGRLCQSPGHTPKENDLISVRGYGRMRYKGVESLSKKGKCNTIVEIYV
jgi:ribosomal 50S subunit-recycling heat shock protein